jgi:hypothetical protein
MDTTATMAGKVVRHALKERDEFGLLRAGYAKQQSPDPSICLFVVCSRRLAEINPNRLGMAQRPTQLPVEGRSNAIRLR